MQTLNGNELAILIYIYWNQGIAIKNLKENSFYSNSTITKYVKTLQRQGYIYRFGNQLFTRIKNNCTDMVEIFEDIPLKIMKKELSGNHLRAYLAIVFFNEFKKPNLTEIANYLGDSKSNYSFIIKNLIESGIILNYPSSKGLGIINQLVA